MALKIVLVLAMLAAARAAPARRALLQDGVSGDGLQLEPIASSLPDSVSSFNIASIEPLLPLLDPKVVDSKLLAEVIQLTPQLNATWLKQVLPYAPKLDPDTTGRVIKAIAPLFHTVPSANLVEWVKVVQELSPDVVVAATPALTALDAGVAKRLIEAVAAINPDVLVATLNLLANLPSHAWDALIALVDMGVPAINLVGSKLSLLPITVAAPAQFQPGALSVGAITIGH